VNFITGGFGLSKTKACRLVNLAKSVFWYRHKPEGGSDIAVRERLKDLAAKRPRFGCPRLHVLLRREGLKINHKKTERIYG